MLDEDHLLPPQYLYRLSDLSSHDANLLRKDWGHIALWRRQALMEDLEQLGISDTVLFFDEVGRLALNDSDPHVRVVAIRLLRAYELAELIPSFLEMMTKDDSPDVRAEAATALGNFVYLGELEELSEKALHAVEAALLYVAAGSDEALVRRRALEALGYSSRKEVAPLIQAAYTSGKEDWLVTALFAMGRTGSENWHEKVLSHLDDERPSVAIEAIAAAGELEIKQAAPRLLEMLGNDDEDIVDAAVWSLSQIGGDNVREAIEQLLDSVDEDERIEFLEDALDNLSFTEDVGLLPILDLDEDDLEADDEKLDLLDDGDLINLDDDEDDQV